MTKALRDKIIQIAIEPAYVNDDGETFPATVYGLTEKGELYCLINEEWDFVVFSPLYQEIQGE